MDSPQKQVIIVLGPTASGKTRLAVDLALYFNTEIISADSRQCCKELNIGVARPTEEELSKVPHHFIASHSIKEDFTAADYEQFALQKTTELLKQNDQVILVGGTGLYIRAFSEGLDSIPAVDSIIRENIIGQYEQKGIQWLQEEVKKKDPFFAAKGEMLNPHRMMRALEVILETGVSILKFQKGQKATRPFSIRKIGIDLPKEELDRRMAERVDRMIKDGLVEEVRSVLKFKDRNALRTVGYTELFDYFEKKINLPKAIELIKIHTRQYAKRQMTWFKKDPTIIWLKEPTLNAALGALSIDL
jgi:tRNA dimethylallyltransferase